MNVEPTIDNKFIEVRDLKDLVFLKYLTKKIGFINLKIKN